MFNNDVTEPSVLSEPDVSRWFYQGDLDKLSKPWVREPHFIPMVVVYGTTFLFGVFGNILVICVLCCGRSRNCVTFPCLLSMAWADLLFLVVCLPYEIVRYFISQWQLSTFLCKLYGFIEMVSATATIFNLILISLERYFVIAHPLTSKSFCTSRNTKIALIITWITSMLLSSPSFIVMNTETNIFYNNSSSVTIVLCGDVGIPDNGRFAYAMWQLVLLFGFPAIVLAFCYIRVILILWISTRQLQTMTSPQRPYGNWRSTGRDNGCASQRSESNATVRFIRNKAPSTASEEALLARRQVIKMLIVIIAVFLVCWGPKLIIHVMKKFEVAALYTQTSFNLILALGCLPYIQSCLNPLIYVLMSKAIRKRIYNALSRYCWLCNVLSHSSGRHVSEFVMTNHSATGQTNFKTTLDTYRSYGANEVTDV